MVRTDELSEDGGPGSGNWGHAGVKGKVGGSAKGTGGKQHRLTTPSGGFTSRSEAEKENKQRSKGGGGGSGGSQGQTIKKGSTLKSSKDLDNARAEYKKNNSDYNDKSFTSYDQGASDEYEIKDQCSVTMERAEEMKSSVYDFTCCSDEIRFAQYEGKEKFLTWYSSLSDESYNKYMAKADAIEEYIQKSPKYTGEIMRGMSLSKEEFDKLIGKVKNKEPIADQGLSSWTSSNDTAQQFTAGKGKYKVVHVLKHGTTKGTPIVNLSAYSTEKEIIISASEKRIATGKIEKVEYYNDVIYYIEEEEIYE